jgi:hypothetical protein
MHVGMKWGWVKALVKIGLCGAAIAAYFAWTEVERSKLRPPQACSFEVFLTQMPPVQQIRVFRVRGEEYLEVAGPLPDLWTLPSGPPSYVFDHCGNLVSWTYDRGEDPGYVRLWEGFPSARPVSLVEARAWIRRASNGCSFHEPHPQSTFNVARHAEGQ